MQYISEIAQDKKSYVMMRRSVLAHSPLEEIMAQIGKCSILFYYV
jgi:hypothetical protein